MTTPDLTPLGKVVAGLHEPGDQVTLTGRAMEFELWRTATSGPSGTFMLWDARTGVRVRVSEEAYARYRRVLGPVCTRGGGLVCMHVTVHGTVHAGYPPGVHADSVHAAGGDIPAGEPCTLPVRLRRSAIGLLLAPERAHITRRAAYVEEMMLPGIVQDVRVHGRVHATAVCTLVGPEDGACISVLVPAPVYDAHGAALMLGASVRVRARLANGAHSGLYLVARGFGSNPGDPGALFTVPTGE